MHISEIHLWFSFFVLYLSLCNSNNEKGSFPSHWPIINNRALELVVFEQLIELLC